MKHCECMFGNRIRMEYMGYMRKIPQGARDFFTSDLKKLAVAA